MPSAYLSTGGGGGGGGATGVGLKWKDVPIFIVDGAAGVSAGGGLASGSAISNSFGPV